MRTTYLYLIIALLSLGQSSRAQDCSGPLNVFLEGANTADSLAVEVEAMGITCTSADAGSIVLNVSGGNGMYSFDWADGVMDASERLNLATGIYTVTITDALGCEEVINTEIDLLTPDQSALAMETSCSFCLLNNGQSSYFFNDDTEYIAQLTDEPNDTESIGGTEVCLNKYEQPGSCLDNPFLERSWSVHPASDEASCVKLFFTQDEFEALANELPDIPAPEPTMLVDEGKLCLTAFSGGSETCDDFSSARIYSPLDADPLAIVLEDAAAGLWSVEVCLNEYATFYFHICDLKLPVSLLSFYGVAEEQANHLYWQTEDEEEVESYQLEYTRNLKNWKKVTKLTAKGDAINNSYDALHKRPGNGLFYYRIKIIEKDGNFSYSDILALNRKEIRQELFYPALFEQYVNYDVELASSDIFEFTFFDESGRNAHKEQVELQKGKSTTEFNLSHLAAANYFVKVVSRKNKIQSVHKLVKWTD